MSLEVAEFIVREGSNIWRVLRFFFDYSSLILWIIVFLLAIVLMTALVWGCQNCLDAATRLLREVFQQWNNLQPCSFYTNCGLIAAAIFVMSAVAQRYELGFFLVVLILVLSVGIYFGVKLWNFRYVDYVVTGAIPAAPGVQVPPVGSVNPILSCVGGVWHFVWRESSTLIVETTDWFGRVHPAPPVPNPNPNILMCTFIRQTNKGRIVLATCCICLFVLFAICLLGWALLIFAKEIPVTFLSTDAITILQQQQQLPKQACVERVENESDHVSMQLVPHFVDPPDHVKEWDRFREWLNSIQHLDGKKRRT